MIDLIKHEVRKIVGNKIFIFGFIVACVLNVLVYCSTSVPSLYAYSPEKDHYVQGMEAVKIEKEVASRYKGVLTDEKVQEILKEFSQYKVEGLNSMVIGVVNGDEEYTQYYGFVELNSIQATVNFFFANADGTYNGVKVADVFKEEISVGYNTGWLSTSSYLLQVTLIVDLFLVTILSRIFSSEYDGMDALIYSSKYGKSKLVTSKIAVAFMIGMATITFFLGVNIVIALVTLGTEGLNSSVGFTRLHDFMIVNPYLLCSELLMRILLLSFSSVVGVVAITLLVSSVCNKDFTALAVAILVYFIPLFSMTVVNYNDPAFILLMFFPGLQGNALDILALNRIPISTFDIEAVFLSIAFSTMVLNPICIYFARKKVQTHQVM